MSDLVSTKKSPCALISKYRSELMGFCILFVLYYHSALKSSLPFLAFLRRIAVGSVDTFMLISGMGIYISLEKNPVSVFYKNRLRKIVPIWYLYYLLIVVTGLLFFHEQFRLREVCGFLTFSGFWLGLEGQGNWYAYAIMLFYLCSPVLFSLIRDSRNRLRTGLMMVVFSLFLSFSFFENAALIAFARLPSYLMGMIFASCFRDRPFDRRGKAISLAFLVLGAVFLILIRRYSVQLIECLWEYGLLWYPYILIVPGFSLFFCLFLEHTERFLQPLLSVVRILGKASLEILVISDYLFIKCGDYFYRWTEGKMDRMFVSFLLFLLGAFGGIVFHALVEWVKKTGAGLYLRLRGVSG